MSNKEKFILTIAGLAIVLALSALVVNILKTSPAQIVDNVGSIGGQLIEDYLPIKSTIKEFQRRTTSPPLGH